ncbi:MAG: YdgA family protein [Campylobacteraceae bacterium]|jgi:hypothetical protein|nr:YdgA family protein [Campylobacteraceae bacterium]
MKKIILFFAGIVIVAALYFCFSAAYANYQVHKSFTSEASYFDRFGIKYELVEQQRGFLNSVYKTKLSMIISRDIVLEATAESRAEFGIKDLNILKIGKIYTNYEYSGNIKDIFGENMFNYIANNMKNVVFDIKFDGITGKITQEPQSLTYEIDLSDALGLPVEEKMQITYDIGAASQEIKVSFDSQNIFISQHIDELTSQSNVLNQTAKIEEVDYDIALNKNDIGTWLGHIKSTAKRYDLHVEDIAGSFTNYKASASAEEENDDLLSINLKSSADELALESKDINFKIKDFLVDITVSHLEQSGINNIANKLSKINLGMGETEKTLLLGSAGVDIVPLLKFHPKISLTFAGSYNGSKTNEISGHVQYIGEDAFKVNILNFMEYLDFELKYSIDKNMLISLLQQYERDRGERLGYSLSEEEIEQIGKDSLSKFQEIGADIGGDMIKGVINKNTNFSSL